MAELKAMSLQSPSKKKNKSRKKKTKGNDKKALEEKKELNPVEEVPLTRYQSDDETEDQEVEQEEGTKKSKKVRKPYLIAI